MGAENKRGGGLSLKMLLSGKDSMVAIRHPVMRYHGGKFRLAPWIIEHFPPHRCYVEPFGGAASVLLQKPRSEAEVYNDLDEYVVNLFRVLRDPQMSRQLAEACMMTPFSRVEFQEAYEHTEEPVEQARRTIVRATMGFGSAGATKGRTGFRLDTRRNCATAQAVWSWAPANLIAVAERFAGVLVEKRDAIQCMLDHDTPDTLHYVDPPYMHEARVMASSYYRHEMDTDQHARLIDVLKALKGSVILSGYETDLYNDMLKGWSKRIKTTAANGVSGSVKRTECLWIRLRTEEIACGTNFSFL